jgi:hypothetical protein
VDGNGSVEAESASSEDELTERMREFGQAWAKSDVDTLDSLLAAEYHHTDIFGRTLNRAEWLEYARAARPVNSMDFRDVVLKFYGGVAVITGTSVIVGQPTSPDSNVNINFTQVWARDNGEWRRAFFQATPIIEPMIRE